MNKASLKKYAAAGIIALTLLAFALYGRAHPEIWSQLGRVGPGPVLLIIALYVMMTAVLTLIYDATLRMTGARLAYRENLLVTIYSSIVNFFGPLQSGPGFRLMYLKRRHNVSMKSYAAATAVYYALFAGLSGLALLLGGVVWQLLVPIVLALAVIAAGGLLVASKTSIGRRALELTRPKTLLVLSVVTALQVLLTCVIYFVELRAVGAHPTFAQAVSYAGAANFALFVALTPGALGFRESFLLFSQGLHHISANTIVVANVLDRGVYVVFLGILCGFVLLTHARRRLKLGEQASDD